MAIEQYKKLSQLLVVDIPDFPNFVRDPKGFETHRRSDRSQIDEDGALPEDRKGLSPTSKGGKKFLDLEELIC